MPANCSADHAAWPADSTVLFGRRDPRRPAAAYQTPPRMIELAGGPTAAGGAWESYLVILRELPGGAPPPRIPH